MDYWRFTPRVFFYICAGLCLACRFVFFPEWQPDSSGYGIRGSVLTALSVILTIPIVLEIRAAEWEAPKWHKLVSAYNLGTYCLSLLGFSFYWMMKSETYFNTLLLAVQLLAVSFGFLSLYRNDDQSGKFRFFKYFNFAVGLVLLLVFVGQHFFDEKIMLIQLSRDVHYFSAGLALHAILSVIVSKVVCLFKGFLPDFIEITSGFAIAMATVGGIVGVIILVGRGFAIAFAGR